MSGGRVSHRLSNVSYLDIPQMLVVGNKIADESQLTNHKNFNIDEFIWPHGITPPLHHVRKRRFRKRVNRRVCFVHAIRRIAI